MKIGGSLYTRNAIRAGYPFIQAIESLLALCDNVIVFDADSSDGTLEALNTLARYHKNLKIIRNAPRHSRRCESLSLMLKRHQRHPWHFLLQADEVIHESSISNVKGMIKRSKATAFTVRRITVFGGLDSSISLSARHSPHATHPIRLGKLRLDLSSDGEGLSVDTRSRHHIRTVEDSEIVTFHYGEALKPIDNEIPTLSFYNREGLVDARPLLSLPFGFDQSVIIAKTEIEPLPIPHPKFAQKWLAEARVKFSK